MIILSGQPMAIGARAILAGSRTPGPFHRRDMRRGMAWNSGEAWSDPFLMSREWRTVRMRALEKHGARCQCCGRTARDGVAINVDHIKPRAKYPELALDENNLQILCNECNHGKGSWSERDWRPPEQTQPDSDRLYTPPGDQGSAALTALFMAVLADPAQTYTPFVARFASVNWTHGAAKALAAVIEAGARAKGEISPSALIKHFEGTEHAVHIQKYIARPDEGAVDAVKLLQEHEEQLNELYAGYDANGSIRPWEAE